MTKKEIKALKKEISVNSAVYVGYYYSVFEMVDSQAVIRLIQDLSNEGYLPSNKQSDFNWDNFILTEYVRKIGYQEFKNLAPYFFGYSA